MSKITDYLLQLDLSELEAQLYIALLESGPISVRDLALKIGLKRTTAYLYVDQLVDKGLISKMVKGSHKMIAANEPKESLKYLVDEKLETATVVKKDFPEVIETIQSMLPQTKDAVGAEVKYFKGKNGVKKIYEDVLKALEVRAYADMSKIAEMFPENAELFNSAFNTNSEVKVFEICENSEATKKYIGNSNKVKNHLYKILPNDMKITAQDVIIYSGKVAIINLNNSISGVILNNSDLYHNFKLLFDFLWKMLPE